jgi:chemotaxis protein MotA
MYIITGGAVLPLLWAMPFGFITIGEASVGILAASNSRNFIEQTLDDLKKVTAGSRFHEVDYVDLLCLLYFLVKLDAVKGAIALEGHIEDAGLSPAFQYFPKILANRTVTAMVCDYLRIVGLNADDPYQIRGSDGARVEENPAGTNARRSRIAEHGRRHARTWHCGGGCSG